MALTRATDKIIANADGNLNLSGIVTASSFRGDGSQLTGIDASTLKNGSDTKAQANASGVVVTGVLTATSYSGDGSNLTNLPAGLGTALSSDQTNPLNKLYYTNEILSIGATVTVDHPATGTGAYTQYADIRLEEGADLIIEDGDDVIPDILGLGTDGGGLGAGGTGRIRVGSITNKNANGAPNFPNGLTGTAATFTNSSTIAGIVTLTSGGVDTVGVVTASSFDGSLNASQITSGTVADARVSASSVTQHVTPFNDDAITNDISILALKVSALENSTASNTNSTYVDTFQDSAGISNFTTAGRDSSGEYVGSVYNAVTNISAGWKGGGNNNTGTDASGATSYTGYDGVTRSKGQLSGNQSGYNAYNLGHIFGASDNFEFIVAHRGSYQGIGRIYGSLGSTLSSIGTYKSEPPQSNSGQVFSSFMGGATYNGVYPSPDGNNYDGTIFYRYFRENNSFKIQYTQSASDVTFDLAKLTALRASSDLITNNGTGSVQTRNEQMLLVNGEAGSTSFIRIEMANTFAETVSATGSVTSVTINAPSTVSKMGVVVTYVDHAGTATLNTDVKLFLSANNGTNFTQVTLAALPLFATGVKMAKANDVTISNTGTQLKWKIEFANQASGSKETRVTGVSLQY